MARTGLWIILVMITILLIGGVYLLTTKTVSNPPTNQPTTTIPTGEIKEFEITARQFGFEPNTITVNKGDTVKLKITSVDVAHGFAINELGINVQLTPGKTEVVEFVANKIGTFTFYCSVVCGSGHSGMRGQLVVKS